MSVRTRKQQLEAMLLDDPNDSFLRYALAMEFVSEGNDAEAAKRFTDMFVDCPDYVPSYVQAGQAWVRLGQSDRAREVFQNGVSLARRVGDDHAAEEMQGMLQTLDS